MDRFRPRLCNYLLPSWFSTESDVSVDPEVAVTNFVNAEYCRRLQKEAKRFLTREVIEGRKLFYQRNSEMMNGKNNIEDPVMFTFLMMCDLYCCISLILINSEHSTSYCACSQRIVYFSSEFSKTSLEWALMVTLTADLAKESICCHNFFPRSSFSSDQLSFACLKYRDFITSIQWNNNHRRSHTLATKFT